MGISGLRMGAESGSDKGVGQQQAIYVERAHPSGSNAELAVVLVKNRVPHWQATYVNHSSRQTLGQKSIDQDYLL